jgi:sulfite reductase alpha subunit-like flavoprotein
MTQCHVENILYFGCRSLSADYYYRDEWKAYGESLEVRVACSRDQVNSMRALPNICAASTYLIILQDHKVYVQDLIKADSSKIKDWILNRGAYVYISG